MDTTRETVEQVLFESGACGNLAAITRDLLAERETLKALCVELAEDLDEWNKDVINPTTSELLTRARSILK